MPIHRLPCVIDYDGEAAIDKFFKHSNGSSSFRGRKLVSSKITAPKGMKFYVMRRDLKEWKLAKESPEESIIQWHHDEVDPKIEATWRRSAEYLEAMGHLMQ